MSTHVARISGFRVGASALVATLLLVAVPVSAATAGAASAGSAASRSVTGTWHLTTTDCVYGCTATVALVQSGHVLSDPSNPDVYGTISGRVMDVVDALGPGHVWQCTGNLNRTFKKLPRGRFIAVSVSTTTTGTCRMVKG